MPDDAALSSPSAGYHLSLSYSTVSTFLMAGLVTDVSLNKNLKTRAAASLSKVQKRL